MAKSKTKTRSAKVLDIPVAPRARRKAPKVSTTKEAKAGTVRTRRKTAAPPPMATAVLMPRVPPRHLARRKPRSARIGTAFKSPAKTATLPTFRVAITAPNGDVKATLGPYTSRREANIGAKTVLLAIGRKIGASVRPLTSSSITDHRKKCLRKGVKLVAVAGEIGYVVARGTVSERRAVVGKDAVPLTIRLNPVRSSTRNPVRGGHSGMRGRGHSGMRQGSLFTHRGATFIDEDDGFDLPELENGVGTVKWSRINPKRRRNHHLSAGQIVSYKGHAAVVTATHPPDSYTVQFDNGSLMTVAGSTLKTRGGR
jgi:hypothetical protein